MLRRWMLIAGVAWASMGLAEDGEFNAQALSEPLIAAELDVLRSFEWVHDGDQEVRRVGRKPRFLFPTRGWGNRPAARFFTSTANGAIDGIGLVQLGGTGLVAWAVGWEEDSDTKDAWRRIAGPVHARFQLSFEYCAPPPVEGYVRMVVENVGNATRFESLEGATGCVSLAADPSRPERFSCELVPTASWGQFTAVLETGTNSIEFYPLIGANKTSTESRFFIRNIRLEDVSKKR